MQIMKLSRVVKKLWWFLNASNTIKNLPDSVIYADASGYIIQANKSASVCFGIENTKTPLRVKDIIVDGMNSVNESLRKKQPVSAIGIVKDKEFYIELNAVRKWNGYYIVIRDVSKLTNELTTERKIARFNGEKNAMLSMIQEDIKSPINSISGFSKGLLDGIGGELTEKQQKYIKIINSNASDLYTYMDKLLEFSYAESSIYASEYSNFDIISFTKEILKDYTNIFEEKKLLFNFEYSSIQNRTIYTDKRAYEGIIRNILETSYAMTEEGYITLSLGYPADEDYINFGLSESKQYIQINVKDTSPGIDKKEMQYLCDPYSQIGKGKINFVRSLRLGCASILTKRALGFIDINSEILQGVMYNIVLPVTKDRNE